VLFIINLAVDYLLLLTAAKVCAICVARLRLLAAAMIGAVYAVAEAAAGGALSGVLVWLGVAAAMLFTAFGRTKHMPRIALVFLSAAGGYAGIMYAVSHFAGTGALQLPVGASALVPVGVFVLSYIVFSSVFRRAGRGGVQISRVILSHNGRSVSFSALHDTGNSLSDPMTGKHILVTDAATASLLFSGTAGHLLRRYDGSDPAAAAERLVSLGCAFRLVPYRSVGTDTGLLPAFMPERVTVDGRQRHDILVAVSPNEVGDGGAYSALISAA